jgi:hypothetical protein
VFTLIVENSYGEQLELTHNAAYGIQDIVGLDPPDAVINTTHNAGFDGSIFNSSYMSSRVITITLAINGPAEQHRINLYRYFKTKMPVRLYYRNGTRDVYIDGYTRTLAVQFFAKKEIAQITVECPRPAFNQSLPAVQEMANIQSLFEFPFAIAEPGIPFSEIQTETETIIANDGDLETGAVIKLNAQGEISTPQIYDTMTGASMIFDVSMEAGDEINIDTRQGQKKATLTREGVTTSIVGKMRYGSTWFVLAPGDNLFALTAASGAQYLRATFTVIAQFEGV